MKNLAGKIHIFLFLYLAFKIGTEFIQNQEKDVQLRDQIPIIQNKISKAKKSKTQIKSYFKDIEEAKRRIEKVAIEVETLQKQFPENISDTENLGLIRSLAESLNIKNIFLSPGDEKTKGFYVSKTYSLKATGTFLQFLILLEKIGSSERLLNVKDVDFKQTKEKQKGRFQLVNANIRVDSYRHNPKHKEDRGFSAIEEDFKAKKKTKKKRKRKRRKRKKKK